MKTGLYNIFFRGLTLLSKFIFIIFLGKYSIDETNLGIFGMLTTSIGFLIYIIGFDFYVFNTREILKHRFDLINKIQNQLIFHFLAYIVIIPLSFIMIFNLGFISIEYLWVFVALIISEHLGQEMYRLYTTLEKSVVANIMAFVRSGLWIWYVLWDYFILKNPLNIQKYIISWAAFSWISFLILFVILLKESDINKFKYIKPDWKWIKEGIKTSSVFFVASLSFQVIQFSDRFMIDYFYGKKFVGVYTAYAQFSNAIEVFTFSAVTMVAYPKLVKEFSNPIKYKAMKAKFSKELIFLTVLLILIVTFVGPIVLKFLGKDDIIKEINTFYVLLLGAFFLIMSNVFHYDLYVNKKDNIILKVAIVAMVVNVVLNLILIPNYGIFGASIATLTSFIIIYVLKFYFSKLIIVFK